MTDQRNMLQIVADTSARYRITTQRLRGRSCTNGLSILRREAMVEIYATRRYTKADIGEYFSGRSVRAVEWLLAQPDPPSWPPIGLDRRRHNAWNTQEARAAILHAIHTACAEVGAHYGMAADAVLCALYDRDSVKARREAIALVLTRTNCPMMTLAKLWGVDRREVQRVSRAIAALRYPQPAQSAVDHCGYPITPLNQRGKIAA